MKIVSPLHIAAYKATNGWISWTYGYLNNNIGGGRYFTYDGKIYIIEYFRNTESLQIRRIGIGKTITFPKFYL